jgi:hypothetical protein
VTLLISGVLTAEESRAAGRSLQAGKAAIRTTRRPLVSHVRGVVMGALL